MRGKEPFAPQRAIEVYGKGKADTHPAAQHRLDSSHRSPAPFTYARSLAFTLLEVMLAIGIFSLILVSIYSIWSGIIKASQVATNAAQQAQRARISIRTLEDALITAQLFTANMPPLNPEKPYYAFRADTIGDFSSVEFVAHLPATFPGVGRYGDNIVRRVRFFVDPKDKSLVMWQGPMVTAIEEGFEPYSLTLARDVQLFVIEYWGQQKETQKFQWTTEWESTNALPKLVRVALGIGQGGKKGEAQQIVYRVISLPAAAVQPDWQMPGMPGVPGGPAGLGGKFGTGGGKFK